jgi:hypothetical protein
MGEINSNNTLDVKLEWKRPVGRPRRRWEDNITQVGKVWIGCVWLRIGTSDWLL